MVAINLEQKIPKILTPSTSNEQGDLIMLEKKPTAALISMDLLNKQFNAYVSHDSIVSIMPIAFI